MQRVICNKRTGIAMESGIRLSVFSRLRALPLEVSEGTLEIDLEAHPRECRTNGGQLNAIID
jgi:hypothetical protein